MDGKMSETLTVAVSSDLTHKIYRGELRAWTGSITSFNLKETKTSYEMEWNLKTNKFNWKKEPDKDFCKFTKTNVGFWKIKLAEMYLNGYSGVMPFLTKETK
jgi:hypothetical protein